jgi:hypothetical protein
MPSPGIGSNPRCRNQRIQIIHADPRAERARFVDGGPHRGGLFAEAAVAAVEPVEELRDRSVVGEHGLFTLGIRARGSDPSPTLARLRHQRGRISPRSTRDAAALRY